MTVHRIKSGGWFISFLGIGFSFAWGSGVFLIPALLLFPAHFLQSLLNFGAGLMWRISHFLMTRSSVEEVLKKRKKIQNKKYNKLKKKLFLLTMDETQAALKFDLVCLKKKLKKT